MRHKRFVCKEIQPFVLQKIETIRQIRTEFEKYITGIDTYEVIKQVCTLTPPPPTPPIHLQPYIHVTLENRSIQK